MRSFPKQLFLHKPDEGVFGDCHRTVIACLLGDEPAKVPHFCDGNPSHGTFTQCVEAYLAPRGLSELVILLDCSLEQLLHSMGHLNAGRYWILGGTSRTGVNHSVLCRGGEIVHDPSLMDAGLVPHLWRAFSVLRGLPLELKRADEVQR